MTFFLVNMDLTGSFFIFESKKRNRETSKYFNRHAEIFNLTNILRSNCDFFQILFMSALFLNCSKFL